MTVLPLMGWFATLNGVMAAVVLGSIAIRRAEASWGRVFGYLCALGGGVALGMWWGLRDLIGEDNPPDDSAKVTAGTGIIAIGLAVVLLVRWLLKPALRGAPVLPPPDPSTRLYSDSTT